MAGSGRGPEPQRQARFTMRKSVLIALVLSACCVAVATAQVPLKWEYRVLTKEQVADLGKKDLAAGLNQLGDEGWEMVAIEVGKSTEYYFKRPRPNLQGLKERASAAEADVALWRERLGWTERMLRKGYVSEQQVLAERAQLKHAEAALEEVKRDLERATKDPTKPPEKSDKPEPKER